MLDHALTSTHRGALATISGLSISHSVLGATAANAWSDSADASTRFSVITFGAPNSLMKSGGRGFLSSKPSGFRRRLFHNVIDPADVVPNAFNRANTQLQAISGKLGIALPTPTAAVQLGITLVRGGAALGLASFPTSPVPTAWRLLVTILNLCAPGRQETGVHIGSLIVYEGEGSFRRLCEGNEEACMDRLLRNVDFNRAQTL
jgi:hypothetical protein